MSNWPAWAVYLVDVKHSGLFRICLIKATFIYQPEGLSRENAICLSPREISYGHGDFARVRNMTCRSAARAVFTFVGPWRNVDGVNYDILMTEHKKMHYD